MLIKNENRCSKFFFFFFLSTTLILQFGCWSGAFLDKNRYLLKQAQVWSLEKNQINYNESFSVPESLITQEINFDSQGDGIFVLKLITENSELKDYDEVVLSMRRDSTPLYQYLQNKLRQSKFLKVYKARAFWLSSLRYIYNEDFDFNEMWNIEHTLIPVNCADQLIIRRPNFYEWLYRGEYGDGYGQLSVKLPKNYFTAIQREKKNHSFRVSLNGQNTPDRTIIAGRWVLEVKFKKTIIEKDAATPLNDLRSAKKLLMNAKRKQSEYSHSSSQEYANSVKRENSDRRMRNSFNAGNQYYNPALADSIGESLGYAFGTSSEYKADQIHKERSTLRNEIYNIEDAVLTAEHKYEDARAKNFMVKVPKETVFERKINILPNSINTFSLFCKKEATDHFPTSFDLKSSGNSSEGKSPTIKPLINRPLISKSALKKSSSRPSYEDAKKQLIKRLIDNEITRKECVKLMTELKVKYGE